AQLRTTATTASTDHRRRVIRLVIKDVLIGPEKITIRHRIPTRTDSTRITQRDPQPDTEGDNQPRPQLRWGRGFPAAGQHLPARLALAAGQEAAPRQDPRPDRPQPRRDRYP